jgi:hypothetical protein
MLGESVVRSWVDVSSAWRDGPGSVGGRGDGGGTDGSIVSVDVAVAESSRKMVEVVFMMDGCLGLK